MHFTSKIKYYLIYLHLHVLVLLLLSCHSRTEDPSEQSVGKKESPESKVQLLAPGVISTSLNELNVTFYPGGSLLLYTIAILYVAMKAEIATRHTQQKLSAESTRPLYLDEDDYWIYGIFYYNPEDKKRFINNRVGIGTTMNLAHKSGKIIIVLTIACLLALPISGLYVMKEEFTPLRAEFLNDRIVVTHTKEELVLSAKDIKSVEIVDTLPDTTKVVGTGMEHLLKGTFHVSGYGKCRLYLNPKQSPFLILTTDEGLIIINANDSIIEKIKMQNLLNN